jgi:hypothetical protein
MLNLTATPLSLRRLLVAYLTTEFIAPHAVLFSSTEYTADTLNSMDFTRITLHHAYRSIKKWRDAQLTRSG